ncbi:MAG: lysophospholipid acyltransferase family protein [Deltaproteobacteria bacterium]|nr:lysophospholipid acyltransferase family protein [Deltaproteobacteria bacterium]
MTGKNILQSSCPGNALTLTVIEHPPPHPHLPNICSGQIELFYVYIPGVWNQVKILSNRLLYWFGKNIGIWVIRLVVWVIATGYFFFFPRRVKASLELYRTAFKNKNPLFYLHCVWRQFHDLAQSHCDEIAFSFGMPIHHTSEGRDNILKAANAGRGGIIIMSHMGSWGIAARIFRQDNFKVMLIMGERQAKLIDQQQRGELEGAGLKILVSKTDDHDSLFTGIEALKFIREGGFLCIAGDIGWTDPRSRLTATFFGRSIYLPAGPHTLALVSGAPVFTLFAYRLGRGNYQVVILPPRIVKAASRDARSDAIRESAQIYASNLEEAVQQYPFEWHVFESIFVK